MVPSRFRRRRAAALILLCFTGTAPAQPPPAAPTFDTSSEPAPEIAEALERALADLRLAEARGPDLKEAFERARASLDFVLQRDPANLRGKYYSARLLIIAGRAADAQSTLIAWTRSRQGQNDWEGHLILGQLYNEGKFPALAEPILEKAAELNPNDPRVLGELAKAEANLMKREEAINHARDAVKAMGKDVSSAAYILLAETLALNAQLEDANKACGYAIQLAAARVGRTGADVPSLKALDEAVGKSLGVLQKLVQAQPGNVEAYLAMANLLQERIKVTSLLAVHDAFAVVWRGMQVASQGGKAPPEALTLEAAKLLLKLNRRNEALSVLNKLLELYPQNTEAATLREQLLAQQQEQPPPGETAPPVVAPAPPVIDPPPPPAGVQPP